MPAGPCPQSEGLRLTDPRLKIRIALYDLHTAAAFIRWNLKRRGSVRRGVCWHHDGLAVGPQGGTVNLTSPGQNEAS